MKSRWKSTPELCRAGFRDVLWLPCWIGLNFTKPNWSELGTQLVQQPLNTIAPLE